MFSDAILGSHDPPVETEHFLSSPNCTGYGLIGLLPPPPRLDFKRVSTGLSENL